MTLPRSEVDEALQAGEGEAELLLDVVRATNGDREQRRVAVAWDRIDLERLAREATGERVTLAIDAGSLEQAFEADVEAHGIRQTALALSIVAVTAGATVGGARERWTSSVEGRAVARLMPSGPGYGPAHRSNVSLAR